VSPVAAVAEASAFFFLAAAANAGVNARQTTSIRIAVNDAKRVPLSVIDLSCLDEWRDGASGAIASYFVDKKRTIEVPVAHPRKHPWLFTKERTYVCSSGFVVATVDCYSVFS
jgi:hypothetical protein